MLAIREEEGVRCHDPTQLQRLLVCLELLWCCCGFDMFYYVVTTDILWVCYGLTVVYYGVTMGLLSERKKECAVTIPRSSNACGFAWNCYGVAVGLLRITMG